ncbi:hypothetical protein D3C86_2086050 [compost metagenome]
MQEIVQVNAELRQQGLIETQLVINLLIGAVVGVRPDNRQHRINRHHATDKKGQQQQAKQRHQHLRQPLRETAGTGAK